MSYSELTQRSLDKYTRKMVRTLPNWVKIKFHNKQISFFIDDESGTLGVQLDNSLDPQLKEKIYELIGNYMSINECPALQALEVQ